MQKFPDIKLIAFDFDGVIADSLQENIKTTNIACSKFGAEKTVNKDLLQNIDCMAFNTIAEKIKLPPHNYDKALNLINSMLSNSYLNIQPFAGIPEILHELYLNDMQMIIITHNTEKTVALFLEKYNLNNYFSNVLGAESPGGKDFKLMITLENEALCPCSAMMIGDSAGDMHDAIAADVIPCGVAWGFQSKQKLLQAGADIVFQKPYEIIKSISLK